MLEFFRKLFLQDFLPHAYCLRQAEVIWLHVCSDATIALAYLAIPIALLLMIRRREDLEFSTLFWLFGTFILACGATHAMSIYVLWNPAYRLEGLLKALTATVSALTAIATFRLLPTAVAWPSAAALEEEIQVRKRAEADVRELNATLEQRVAQRTQELRLSNSRFQAAMDAVGDILWTNSADGRMTGEQPAWSRLTGQSFEEYQGYGWSRAVHPEDAQPTIEAWNEAVAARRVFVFEHRVRRRDGVWRRFAIRGVPVIDENGAILEWVGVHRDITEERERLSELQRAREQAESASRAKSTFLANMSHELRTPLSSIIGYSEMMIEQGQGDPSSTRDLRIIQSAGRHLLGIINAVLDLSKIEAGKMEAVRELFSLQPMIEEVRLLIEPLAERNGNRLRVEIGEGIGEMNSDEQKVRQTLLNLLGNAAKFTSCGEVLLRVHEEGGRVVFEVSDSGIGMDEEQCVKVFEAFAQGSIPKGSWQVGTQFGGTGLGLTISKRFVEMLGGEIHCKSEVGKGTTFWMTLPKE